MVGRDDHWGQSYTVVYLGEVPDWWSTHSIAASQRRAGRTTAVLRGLVASNTPCIYVVHNQTMVDVAQRIIAELCAASGTRSQIQVISIEQTERVRGSRGTMFFDHVCVENALHLTASYDEARRAGELQPKPETPPVRKPKKEPPPRACWARLRARCTKKV